MEVMDDTPIYYFCLGFFSLLLAFVQNLALAELNLKSV
jgi:hypothetical protein